MNQPIHLVLLLKKLKVDFNIMSLKLIKNNTSSPFHLQRSIVPQGDEDGAYARGGFNPDALYNLDAANAAVESIGTTVGAALSSRSKSKKPDEEKKPETKTTPKKTEVVADNQKFDIKNQTTSNYSDYSGNNKSNELESARDTYEKKQKKLKHKQKQFK